MSLLFLLIAEPTYTQSVGDTITFSETLGSVKLTTYAQSVGDTVAFAETLGSVEFTTYLHSTADTVVLSETLRTQTALARAETLSLTEALTGLARPFDFIDTLEIAARINGGRFRFLDQVRIVQAPLIDFTDTVAIHRALQDFTDRLRILPDVATLFAEDIQRPVGRVEEV